MRRTTTTVVERIRVEWPYDDTPRFPLPIAARLAGVSPALVRHLERLGWIQPKVLPGGGKGYSLHDVRLLIRVREWREVLGLNMAGVEVALHLRNQILALQEELARMEAEMERRVAALNAEIQRLRRILAEEGRWVPEDEP